MKQGYQYLFRCSGSEKPVLVKRRTRPGNAEREARALAKKVGVKIGAEEVVCIWKGPEGAEIPAAIRNQLRREAAL